MRCDRNLFHEGSQTPRSFGQADARWKGRGMTDQDTDVSSGATVKFKRSRSLTKMPSGQAQRQGAIANLAFTSFGDRDLAISFLNTHHAHLDARPLDVASESSEGFDEVSRLIIEQAG